MCPPTPPSGTNEQLCLLPGPALACGGHARGGLAAIRDVLVEARVGDSARNHELLAVRTADQLDRFRSGDHLLDLAPIHMQCARDTADEARCTSFLGTGQDLKCTL